MNTISKPLSKTVQRRQLKRLRPQHYEIITRYMNGQRLGEIATKMGIGPQWVSVVINSPLAQEEMERRLKEREQQLIKKISEEQSRRLESQVAAMRYGVRIPMHTPTLDRFEALQKRKSQRHEASEERLAEFIIKSVAQISRKTNESSDGEPEEKKSSSEPSVEARTPEPKPEPLAQPVIDECAPTANTEERQEAGELLNTPQVQAARFYSQILGE